MQYLSDNEQTRARGELNSPPTLVCKRGMVDDEDHDELDEIDEDLDRVVAGVVGTVESDATEPGDEVNGVVHLLGSS